MFAGIGWNALMSGLTILGYPHAKFVDPFNSGLNMEMHMRGGLMKNFGLAGFLAYYFMYDLDFTVPRLVLTALRPDLTPFLWDETECQYWGDLYLVGMNWWETDDERWDAYAEQGGFWGYWT